MCVKQVPDTTDVKIDPLTGVLIRDEVAMILNPDDHSAIEVALRIKEGLISVRPDEIHEIVLFTMGLPKAEAVLIQGLAMGADLAYLVSDKSYAGSDTFATALVLRDAIKYDGSFDLIICGRQAIDGDTAQVGPMIAEMFDLPQLAYVDRVDEVRQDGLIVHREFMGRSESIHIPFGSLLTIVNGETIPRPVNAMRLLAIRRSKDKIRLLSQAELNIEDDRVGLRGSLTKVIKSQSVRYDKTDQLWIDGEFPDICEQVLDVIMGFQRNE